MSKKTCGCFSLCSAKKKRTSNSRIHAIAHVQRSLQQAYEPMDGPDQSILLNNTITVHTTRAKSDLEVSCVSPKTKDQSRQLKYTCPICMRHMNSMLASKCCRNYVCILCVDDMLARRKAHPTVVLRCPFCNNEDLHLQDVDPAAPVKKYSNTPDRFMSTAKHQETPHDTQTPGEVRPFSSASSSNQPLSECRPRQLQLTNNSCSSSRPLRSVHSVRSEPAAFQVPAFDSKYIRSQEEHPFFEERQVFNIKLQNIKPHHGGRGWINLDSKSPYEVSKNSTRPSDTFLSPAVFKTGEMKSPSPPLEESKVQRYISKSRKFSHKQAEREDESQVKLQQEMQASVIHSLPQAMQRLRLERHLISA